MPGPNDFTAYPVARGRLTNARTASYLDFHLNPTAIRPKGGASLAEDAIPGYSDPLLRFASGKTKVISFSLQLDGEIRRRLSGNQVPNTLHGERSLTDYCIAGELEFLESLTFPADPTDGGDGGLDQVIFKFGTYFQSVPCFVESADPEITQFDPALAPTRATVSLVLKRVVDTNRFSNQIWQGQ